MSLCNLCNTLSAALIKENKEKWQEVILSMVADFQTYLLCNYPVLFYRKSVFAKAPNTIGSVEGGGKAFSKQITCE